jgi:hypothetical protein
MSETAHVVQFVHASDGLVAAAARFIGEGLAAGDTCMVIATADHRDGIESQLRAAGLNPSALSAEYRYIPLDATQMLGAFFNTITGIDQQRFHRHFGQLISQAAARGQPVRIFGEMVGVLVEQGRAAAAIELEELWNELSRQYSFTMFCAYCVSSFTENPRYRQLLHGTHSHVLGGED